MVKVRVLAAAVFVIWNVVVREPVVPNSMLPMVRESARLNELPEPVLSAMIMLFPSAGTPAGNQLTPLVHAALLVPSQVESAARRVVAAVSKRTTTSREKRFI